MQVERPRDAPAGLSVAVESSLAEVPAAEWDALVDADDPFTEHAFLLALESSGSVGRGTGWTPMHLVVRAGGRLCGAAPLYLKTDSYGEFIFDWGWANAAERSGLRYYPKLVSAVPFTPVGGRRLLCVPGAGAPAVRAALAAGMRAAAERTGVSSVHVLFCGEDESAALASLGFVPRLSMQFHWTNRPGAPYRDFDDYLGAFKSRARKEIRKERERAGAGLRIAIKTGPELGDAEWRALRRFYLANVARHGGVDYLTGGFFDEIRRTYAHRLVAAIAYRDGEPVAGTINFEKGRGLFGRYWGALVEHEFLHFDLCYHRLIERAIARGCVRFEAGAQGEHKLKRGLLPALTHSAHLVRHAGLRDAIAGFCQAEADAVRGRVVAYAAHSPFADRSLAAANG